MTQDRKLAELHAITRALEANNSGPRRTIYEAVYKRASSQGYGSEAAANIAFYAERLYKPL
jgi:hypothetical protein